MSLIIPPSVGEEARYVGLPIPPCCDDHGPVEPGMVVKVVYFCSTGSHVTVERLGYGRFQVNVDDLERIVPDRHTGGLYL